MRFYNFRRLINKYSISFTLLQAEPGAFDITGKWTTGKKLEESHRGVIAPYTSQMARTLQAAGGQLSADDRRLMTLYPLPVRDDSRVSYKDRQYAISEESLDQSEYGGVYIYLLKYIEKVS